MHAAARSVQGSTRNIAWLDLTIGGPTGVEPDPALIFDALAVVVYETLVREGTFSSYLSRMQFYPLPALPLDQVDTTHYKQYALIEDDVVLDPCQTC
jgi:hypothetical protein